MAKIYSWTEVRDNAPGDLGVTNYIPVTPTELGEWQEFVVQAQEAAEGGSNDTEIEVLRDAVEFACQFFGGEL